MKKIILAVLTIIFSLSAIGQNLRPKYFDDYLLPKYIASGCYDTIVFPTAATSNLACNYDALARPFL